MKYTYANLIDFLIVIIFISISGMLKAGLAYMLDQNGNPHFIRISPIRDNIIVALQVIAILFYYYYSFIKFGKTLGYSLLGVHVNKPINYIQTITRTILPVILLVWLVFNNLNTSYLLILMMYFTVNEFLIQRNPKKPIEDYISGTITIID